MLTNAEANQTFAYRHCHRVRRARLLRRGRYSTTSGFRQSGLEPELRTSSITRLLFPRGRDYQGVCTHETRAGRKTFTHDGDGIDRRESHRSSGYTSTTVSCRTSHITQLDTPTLITGDEPVGVEITGYKILPAELASWPAPSAQWPFGPPPASIKG